MAHYVDGFVIPLPRKHLNADVKRMIYGGFKIIVEA